MTWNPALTSIRARILVGILAFLAYVPSLSGEFLYDDVRFIQTNEAIHQLSFARALSYFTDPRTIDENAWKGIYRPLRTLEFAVDWAIAGESPWFFHLRSMIWHVLGSILVLELFRRLMRSAAGPVPAPAWCGALLYALHPVHTECVAFISSRGDLLCAILFLAALISHVDGHRVRAALLLLAAMLAKEMAVVFAGIALLVDLYRRDRLRFGWYGVYLLLAGAFTAFWFLVVAQGNPEEMGQTGVWWGGSYAMNVATMGKGFLYYLDVLLLPVDLATAYQLPTRSTLDAGTVISIVLLLIAIGVALSLGRRSRFAVLWFALAILPVSNLIIRMNMLTEYRNLLLPSIGFCFALGCVVARRRVGIAVIVCFFALTFARTFDWRNEKTLWTASLAAAESPRALSFQTGVQIEIADRTGLRRDAEQVVRTADAFFRYYYENLQMQSEGGSSPVLISREDGGPVLYNKARALLLLGRYEEAEQAGILAAEFGGIEDGYRLAEIARQRRR